MIASPDYIAQTPEDALSEVLGAVRLNGGHIGAHVTPAAGETAFADGAPSLLVVRQGGLHLCCADAGDGPVALAAGDLALLAHGSPFSVRCSPPDGTTQDSPACAWLRGTFSVDTHLSGRLLSCLPRAVVLRQVSEDAMDWLEIASQFAMSEIRAPEQGAALMVSRIVELLLIRTLRLWAADPAAPASWLTGAADPAIGHALGLMHRQPDRNWTVPDLARQAGLSRSVFAERFAGRVGQPPLRYLIGLRLDKAAEYLRRTGSPVALVARTVGYDSEAAFSRAFKLRFGASPAHWRRSSGLPVPD